MRALLARLADWLTEEPSVEHITQPEDPTIEAKRKEAQLYLQKVSPRWRDRRNQNALKDPSGTHEGSAS